MNIEPLEARIAPASLTFTDVDGDSVVITTTGTGTLVLGGNVIITPLVASQGVALDLTDAAFQGANVSIVATRDLINGGDSHVNIGYINATGVDLGKVLVDGDLGQIDAGNKNDPASACKSLTVRSLGRFGTSTGAPDLQSDFNGKLNKLIVKSDVKDASVVVIDSSGGGTNGKIGSIVIGGSLLGGSADGSGLIDAADGIGAVTIKGDILGGNSNSSGVIRCDGAIASVKVGGSMRGGASTDSDNPSGAIFAAGVLGPVRIGGNLEGGSGDFSGRISSFNSLTSLSIRGSIIGGGFASAQVDCGKFGPVIIGGNIEGSGDFSARVHGGTIASLTLGGSLIGKGDGSAEIFCAEMGPVKILGNIEGASVTTNTTITFTGFIHANHITSLFVGGSIIAGDVSGGGTLIASACVQADDDIGAIIVKGSIIGKPGATVQILARGQAAPGATTDLAIKNITVGGRVERTDILAGYTRPSLANPPVGTNADAQIGRVVVRDWIASNLVAGVQDDADPARNDSFGEGDDQAIAGGSPGIVSKIASITIKGFAVGTPRVNQGTGIDSFGFLAQQIGSFKVGTSNYPLTPGPANDLAGLIVGASGDLRVREVAIL